MRVNYPRMCLGFCLWLSVHAVSAESPSRETVSAAVKQATNFMMNEVSNRGGFLWLYTEDLSEQWGEIPARKSMCWVQDPGTVGVGEVLLKAYEITGDRYYLEQAERVAGVLIWGQYPSGGWHYLIDFDQPGLRQWYDDVASQCWGWIEYYHYDGNCTFDDSVTTGVTRFLLNLYMTTLDAKYRTPLLKALAFVMESQYPNGAWPQRYPLEDRYPRDGQSQYTAYPTLNDRVTQDNIDLLWEAYERLGREEYREAALRGMGFLVLSQGAVPQAGWAQQYDLQGRPVQARAVEPAALSSGDTQSVIRSLLDYYKMTGDKSYLRGIPDALQWLEESRLPPGHTDSGYSHALFYEPGTNKPLYVHREGANILDGRYWTDYSPIDIIPGYGYQVTIDVASLRAELARVSALSPEEAALKYRTAQDRKRSLQSIPIERAADLIESLDGRGAWLEEITIPDFHDYINGPKRTFRGIATRTYIQNMKVLLGTLKAK